MEESNKSSVIKEFFELRDRIHKEFALKLNSGNYKSHEELEEIGAYVKVTLVVYHGQRGNTLGRFVLTDKGTKYKLKAFFNGKSKPFRIEVNNKVAQVHINSLNKEDNHTPLLTNSIIQINIVQNMGVIGSIAAGLSLKDEELANYVERHCA